VQTILDSLQKVASAAASFATILVAVGVVWVLYRVISAIGSGQWAVLKDVAELAYARGLITLAITVATIAIAVLLVTTAVFGIVSSDDQFRRAREVFSVLAGVLGTIVGFYFGSAEKERPQGVKLAEVKVVTSGQGSRIVTAATAGTPPYRYRVEVEGKTVASGESKDGLILAEVQGPRPGALSISVEDNTKLVGSASWTAPSEGGTAKEVASAPKR
jgi:hypothetical protein